VSSIIGIQVIVYMAVTDVGDVYGPYVFRFPKTSEELEAFFKEKVPQEFPEVGGLGMWGSNLTLEEAVCEVRQ
jgi:hypothetical protein